MAHFKQADFIIYFNTEILIRKIENRENRMTMLKTQTVFVRNYSIYNYILSINIHSKHSMTDTVCYKEIILQS